MDIILDMKHFFQSYVCFSLLPIDVAWDKKIILFMLGNYIGILFWQNGAGHCRNGCNLFIIRCN